MSGFVPEPARSDEKELATRRHGGTGFTQGQRHDRLKTATNSIDIMADVDDSSHDAVADISASQKMLSAVSGSLFTSLLGWSTVIWYIEILVCSHYVLVTPLDVVRVRLQSQPTSSSLSSLRTAASSIPFSPRSPFSNLPPNLGVTACCREVFWVNNTTRFCMASAPSLNTLDTPSHISTTSAAVCAVDETRRKTFTSTFDGLRKIARYEGLSSLWRGLSPTLLMSIPGNVIYFTGYDILRSNPHSPVKTYVNENFAPLIAGSIARVAAAAVVSPIEMFRTRMQATSSGPTSVFKDTLLGLQDLVRSQGYTSLWRGLTLTMWRDVPFSGIYWWGYEATRNVLTDIRDERLGRTLDPHRSITRPRSRSRSQENHTATFLDSFLAGAASGAVAAIVTTPFDVGKTRQQVLKHVSEAGPVPAGNIDSVNLRPEERSMPRFLYHIFRTEGVPGLFKGWAARCLKVAPACAIMISSYEIGKKMARNVNEKKREEWAER